MIDAKHIPIIVLAGIGLGKILAALMLAVLRKTKGANDNAGS